MEGLKINPIYDRICDRLKSLAKAHYGQRLKSIVVFGSVARGTSGPESDIDVLIVAAGLPWGRLRRMEDFQIIEDGLQEELARLKTQGISTDLSVIFKTPEEAGSGSPLFLDMVEDAAILYDDDNFFSNILGGLRERLKALGAKRVKEGERWYWILKPDYCPGEVFKI